MNITIFLILTALARFALASLFPLTADESYYWLWSKHLALSYVDHPPMVALVNFLFTFGRENLLLIRLGAVLITTLVTLLIYLLAKELYNEKVAYWSAVLFQIIPHFVVVWLTQFVELPLALFWTLSLFIFAKISNFQLLTSKPASLPQTLTWLLLGLSVGLGALSKYTMFLFWPCLVVFFILSPENRFWLKRKEPYLCFLLSALCFLPIMLWNSQHHWVSFAFHGAKVSGDPWGANALPFIGDQLVHFTPFLIITLFFVFRSYLLTTHSAVGGSASGGQPFNPSTLLLAFSLPVLALFLLLSLKAKVWAHWPSIGYIAAIPLTINYLLEKNKSLGRFIAWISLFSFLILFILLRVSPGIRLHQKEYAENYKLRDTLPKLKVFTKTNVSASLLEFYSQRPTYLATGFLKIGQPWGEKQYELWGIPMLAKGEDIIYFGEDTAEWREKATAHFQQILPRPDLHIYLIEDYINNNYRFFELRGFKGPRLTP